MNEHKAIMCDRLFTRKVRQFWLYLDGGGAAAAAAGGDWLSNVNTKQARCRV